MMKMKNRFHRLHLLQILRRLLKSTLFLKNFLALLFIILVVFSIFSIYVYRQTLSVLNQELIASSEDHLTVTAQSVDSSLSEIRYISATLETNTFVSSYLNNPDADKVFENITEHIQDMLLYYSQGYSAIDSIYLYSELNNTILTQYHAEYSIHSFSDSSWYPYLDQVEEPGAFQIFFRGKHNAYPFLMNILKVMESDNYRSAILINVDLKNLPALSNISKNRNQEIFLVSDDSEVLYRAYQEDITEPLSCVPYLQHFRTEATSYSTLVNDGNNSYVFAQIHSERYPWSYVTVTHLQDYDAQLADKQATIITLISFLLLLALVLAFFFALRAVKPIHGLLTLVESPVKMLSDGFYSKTEIQYIADSIISSIQVNEQLSKELDERLHLLNESKLVALQSQINPHFLFNTLNLIHILECEALGYGHNIPKLTLSLSKLLRYAIDSVDLVELSTELDYCKLYISILKERYQELNVVYDIDESANPVKVPKLFIQPIIENAIFHGLSKHMSPGSTLTLSCCVTDGMCVVTVKDNGVGIKPEILDKLQRLTEETDIPRTSIGLKNVIVRMRLLYQEHFSVEIDSIENEGSTFTLRFPTLNMEK